LRLPLRRRKRARSRHGQLIFHGQDAQRANWREVRTIIVGNRLEGTLPVTVEACAQVIVEAEGRDAASAEIEAALEAQAEVVEALLPEGLDAPLDA
jgi:hypothetical protein